MKYNSINQIFLLIATLVITPFILFLGKNFLQTEFIKVEYFLVMFFYFLLFTCAAAVMLNFFKKGLIFVLFFAYFSFLQFYFFNIQQFLMIHKSGTNEYYTLILIILVSFVMTLTSRSAVFRNFILILLFLNVTLAVIKLSPATIKYLQTFFKTTNIINNSSNTTSLTSAKYSNIFYIIPDEMASPKILKDYADIKFKDTIKKFEEKGFSVPKHSYSSYNMTPMSLAALFEMDYLVTEKSPIYKDREKFYPVMRDKKPKILQYLKKNNYEFIIVPPVWGGCPKSKGYRCLTPAGNFFYSNFTQDYTVSTMFQYSIIKKILDRFNLTSLHSDMDDSAKTALEHMKINSKYWKDGGVFTMIHMMMPHTPHRKENCSTADPNLYTGKSKEQFKEQLKKGYRSSVYCALSRIHELSDHLIKNYPNASIVVQSDHGVDLVSDPSNIKFIDIPQSLIDHRLGAFTAVRGCNSNEAAKLNQAHIVEFLVDCIVNGKTTKHFENKSFFGFFETQPEFGKIYRIR